MILNVFAVTSAFLALVGFALAVTTGVVAGRGLASLRRRSDPGAPESAEASNPFCVRQSRNRPPRAATARLPALRSTVSGSRLGSFASPGSAIAAK